VVLIAVDLVAGKLAAIEEELDAQARALSRVEILQQSIPKSIIVRVPNVDQAIAFSNDYAPEHLILHLENASSYLPSINNAGSIFVGPYTPERYEFFSIIGDVCSYTH
jgi:phosphoribosyl-ATP pyrophosphohydrolase/phosphoribosyl-AMP cyclohydrolase/histidinol dehydrogenase